MNQRRISYYIQLVALSFTAVAPTVALVFTDDLWYIVGVTLWPLALGLAAAVIHNRVYLEDEE